MILSETVLSVRFMKLESMQFLEKGLVMQL
jgi:hypothetical protein